MTILETTPRAVSSIAQDALSALENLGYRQGTILKVLTLFKTQIEANSLELPELIRLCLKELAQSSSHSASSSS